MLVQCPSCSARYRVNASNIPNTGGRIRCPSCEHTFVVYPEAPAPAPQAAAYEEAKTSIANIQDLMQGANALRQQSEVEEEDGATEIMSGAALPNFSNLFGGGGAPERIEDGTVEMQNPLALLNKAGLAPRPEEDGATEIVSADMMFGMGGDPFQTPASVPASTAPSYPPAASANSSAQPSYTPASHQPAFAPQRTVTHQNDATQITGADSIGDFSFPPPASSSPSGQALGSALFGGAPDTVEAISPFSTPPAHTPHVPPAHAPPAYAPPAHTPPAMSPVSPSPPPAGGSTMDPSYMGPWKLKTSFGLTYEFQDTASLQTWMSSRDDLSGYTLAGDDEQFRELAVYPQLGGGNPPSAPTMAMHRVSPQSAPPLSQPPAPMPTPGPGPLDMHGGGFDAPSQQPSSPRQPGARITNTEYKPPRGNRRWVTVILFLLFAIFGLGAVGLSLHIFKVVDMKEMLGLEVAKPKVTPPPKVKEVVKKTPPKVGSDEAPTVSPEAKAQAAQFIKEAEVNIENNKLPPARQVLEKALTLDPTNLKTYDLLADTYDKLGQSDKATEIREKVKTLRADSGADDEPPPELTP